MRYSTNCSGLNDEEIWIIWESFVSLLSFLTASKIVLQVDTFYTTVKKKLTDVSDCNPLLEWRTEYINNNSFTPTKDYSPKRQLIFFALRCKTYLFVRDRAAFLGLGLLARTSELESGVFFPGKLWLKFRASEIAENVSISVSVKSTPFF